MKKENQIQLPILRSSYDNLTKSERRIADYILANAKNFIEQTVSDIAANTGSSEITVSRFCKKLGFSGLQGLKIALAREIFSPDETVYQDISVDDNYDILAGKIFKNISDGLQDTLKLLNFKDVESAVELLSKARRIVTYGFGNSATVCRDIETRFIRFGIPVQAYCDSHQQFTSASLLNENDAVIAVSHTGESIELLESVKIARKSKAKIVAVTSYARSSLAKLADISLNGMGREVHYRSEAVASRLIHMAIIDLLYTGIAIKNHDSYMKNIGKMRKVIAQKRL
ncbi:MurR/RpiR family transcriptional regulator [Pectinatus haikarae]|uniref:DNA-binding MurR/RpiR family transcriptional regulator n=1 Tax=Pectinatus haikarae TaxID=349096 RepID=A0ABT9Y8W6_9FIRM|nr:MurR/RpiR family transcriptional regulator [Pectinatus haikarae]MDQ0204276.1 DNA-binding MurR/RpiR family transcriptional regulator [Pectinatus haikarae]